LPFGDPRLQPCKHVRDGAAPLNQVQRHVRQVTVDTPLDSLEVFSARVISL
jgi:hypothetical protein